MKERTLFDALDEPKAKPPDDEMPPPLEDQSRRRRRGVCPDSGTDTSRDAAERIAPLVPAMTAVVYRFIAERGEAGATDHEVQVGLGISGDSERPRRWELQRCGLVRDSGARRKSPSGRNAIVYVANGRKLPSSKTQAG